MWTLMKYEYQKLFHSRWQKGILLLLLLLPILYGEFRIDQNTRLVQQQFTPYEGVITPQKMAQAKEFIDYYSQEDHIEEVDTNQILAAMEYSWLDETTIGKYWNLTPEDESRHESKELGANVQLENFSTFVKEEMNSIDTFTFGTYYHWQILFEAMDIVGVMVAIYLTFTISPIFNSEYTYHMTDIIKASSIGKRKAGLAKILCSISIAIVIPIVILLCYVGYIWLRYGLANGNVTLSVLSTPNPYTFLQAVLYGSGIILIGGLALTAIALWLSSIIKQSYISMSIALFLLIIPMICFFDIGGMMASQLCPFFFMMVSNTFRHFPFLTTANFSMYYKDFIALLWIPITLLLIPLSYVSYRKITY